MQGGEGRDDCYTSSNDTTREGGRGGEGRAGVGREVR